MLCCNVSLLLRGLHQGNDWLCVYRLYVCVCARSREDLSLTHSLSPPPLPPSLPPPHPPFPRSLAPSLPPSLPPSLRPSRCTLSLSIYICIMYVSISTILSNLTQNTLSILYPLVTFNPQTSSHFLNTNTLSLSLSLSLSLTHTHTHHPHPKYTTL